MLRNSKNGDLLGRALDAWRSDERRDEALSAGARDRIRHALRHGPGRREAALATLFVPMRRLVLAGTLPVLLVVSLLVLMHGATTVPTGPGEVRAYKQGDRVVFTIANGGRAHRVYRSTEPDRFDRSAAVTVRNGEFEDAAGNGPDLVFYRID